eukprot:scaffold8718_cov159-Isochrysis_galbana.AAC.11
MEPGRPRNGAVQTFRPLLPAVRAYDDLKNITPAAGKSPSRQTRTRAACPPRRLGYKYGAALRSL